MYFKGRGAQAHCEDAHYCLIYADVHNSDDVILFILLLKASFNKTSWLSMGKVIGVELRSLCTYD